MKRFRNISLSSAALAALLLASAVAAAPRNRAHDSTAEVVRELHFAIELDNRSVDPLIIGPGEGFRILPGQRLEIRAVGNPGSNDRIYPYVRYYIADGGGSIVLTDAHPQKGTVAVEARSASRGQHAVIGYQILENTILDGIAREGRLEVQVDGPNLQPATGTLGAYGLPQDFDNRTSAILVRDLYRGILLREPDQAATSWSDRIDRDGYNGLIEVAQAIAVSPESRNDVYQRGIRDEQRLAALYRHLLGFEQSRISTSAWERGLQMLANHQVPELVTELLRQGEFFDRYNLQRPERRFIR